MPRPSFCPRRGRNFRGLIGCKVSEECFTQSVGQDFRGVEASFSRENESLFMVNVCPVHIFKSGFGAIGLPTDGIIFALGTTSGYVIGESKMTSHDERRLASSVSFLPDTFVWVDSVVGATHALPAGLFKVFGGTLRH